MLIRFKVHFLDYPIKKLCMDNAQEFQSRSFEDYYIATGIDLTYSVPYEYAQNGLVESFIKRIQLITRFLLLHEKFSQELLLGHVPNVSHLQVFGCRVWILLPEPQRHTIGAYRQEGIYVGFDSLNIICYINPSTSSLLHTRFANCRFEEDVFPPLKGGASTQDSSTGLIFQAPQTFTSNPDP